ncbi:MAG: DUF1080 domain-containing protein [Candidatus Bathyarchaeota archaeon]|nr:DUF1080 domain-containing protein [Candidatus Bathyarchaeota archaeon]
MPASAMVGDEEHAYVFFQEDFEDGEAGGWLINIPLEAPPGSGWAVELDEGNHVLSESGQVWAEAGDFTWTNYTFEVKVKLLNPQTYGQINVRESGPAGRYLIGFHSRALLLRKEYHSSTFYDLEDTEIFLNLNKWYTFTIVCVGSNIEVYVDDVLKLDYVDEDDPILSGRIGLESSPDSHIYFDDVKVSTTHRLYVDNLIKEAQDEINEARRVDADTGEAEQRLAEARVAFAEGDLSSVESLAKEALNLAEHAPVGPVSVETFSKYSAEYDQRTMEVSGTIRDIRYEEGVYRFAVDDGTGVVSATYDGTLGEIKTDDRVKVVGTFDASTMTVAGESLEKVKEPMEGLYTFLIFKDDFEDGDFSGWKTDIYPEIEGSAWGVETEDDGHVLVGKGHCGAMVGYSDWVDYVFEFRFKLVEGVAFISFRFTPKPEAPDRYTLRLHRYHLTLLKGQTLPGEGHFTELKRVNMELDSESWYDVRIICIGDEIEVYMDDSPKLEFKDEDSPFLSGSIRLEPFAYEGDKPSLIYFDDVKVSRIATTSDIGDLISYAQSEIDQAREVNADVSAAELKLEQAQQALAREDYQIVQYMVDEAVWLAKRANVGEISIKDLRAQATKCSGHTVVVTGTVKNLEALYGVGYRFGLSEGSSVVSITYQGALIDIGDEYGVRVTGIFDASRETVDASIIEKVSSPQTLSGPAGMSWSIEVIGIVITVGGAIVGVGGWMVRTRSVRRRKKMLFDRLPGEIDEVYTSFKMDTRRREGKLYRLRTQLRDEFKQGLIDEENYNVLETRINGYIQEIKDEITREESERDPEKDLDQ